VPESALPLSPHEERIRKLLLEYRQQQYRQSIPSLPTPEPEPSAFVKFGQGVDKIVNVAGALGADTGQMTGLEKLQLEGIKEEQAIRRGELINVSPGYSATKWERRNFYKRPPTVGPHRDLTRAYWTDQIAKINAGLIPDPTGGPPTGTYADPESSEPWESRPTKIVKRGKPGVQRMREQEYEDKISKLPSVQKVKGDVDRMVTTMQENPSRYNKLVKDGKSVVGDEDKLTQFLAGEQFEIDMKPQRVESAAYEIHKGDTRLDVFIPRENTTEQVARMAERMGGQAVLRQGATIYPISPDGRLLSPRPVDTSLKPSTRIASN
jgi:hypothetical protein